MGCLNLRERFGDEYKIGFDPVFDPHGKQQEKIDPWVYVIPCQRGTIYPFGGSLLAVEVEGRAPTAKRIRALDCTTMIQEGEDFLAVTFDVADFDQVAKIVLPRRKRQMSKEQRKEKRRLMTKLNQKNPSPTSSRRPKTPSEIPA
jgi:hypothetical protein